MRERGSDRSEPAFSGVFSGTFLSIVLLALLAFEGARLLPRRFGSEDARPRPVVPRGSLSTEEQATASLFEAASPAVVSIQAIRLQRYRELGSPEVHSEEVEEGSGSGFVWDEDGHVVTNMHVVQGATRFLVRFRDGRAFDGTVIGVAPDYDLAVLSIRAGDRDLGTLPVGSSADLRVGQYAFAIGYPFGLEQTLTVGVVSGLDRQIQAESGLAIRGVIQTDAAINPGNSGGPLLDAAGRLIGVNTAIKTTTGTNTGVGFAVPVDTINRIVPRIVSEGGDVERAILGVLLGRDVLAADAGLQGAVVDRVTPGGPAERAGMQGALHSADGEVTLGDVIVGIDEREIRRETDLYQALEEFRAGDEVSVRVSRPGPDGRHVVALRARLAAFR